MDNPSGFWADICYTNEDWTRTLRWSSGGTPVNLTGYTAEMDVRDAGGTEAVTLTTTNGRITLGGSAGTIALTIPHSVTSTLTPGTYYFDLLVISAGDIRTNLVHGTLTVIQGVSR